MSTDEDYLRTNVTQKIKQLTTQLYLTKLKGSKSVILKGLSKLTLALIVTLIPLSSISHHKVQAKEEVEQFTVSEKQNGTLAQEITIPEESVTTEIKPLPTEVPLPTAAPTVIPTQVIKPIVTQKPVQQKVAAVPQQIFNVQFIWPVAGGVGQISRGVGNGHTGVDIWANGSPSVIAISTGTVVSTGWENYGGGYVIRVKFDNGFSALYAHTLGNYQVSAGQRVGQGQALASMGCTGSCTGPHLHIELYTPAGQLVDGRNYFSK
jgi:murein DD-endopeptidase MepM/ murein hydrolase activator NlpD